MPTLVTSYSVVKFNVMGSSKALSKRKKKRERGWNLENFCNSRLNAAVSINDGLILMPPCGFSRKVLV
jgi:hypothetical protein